MQDSSAFQFLAIDTIHESTTNPRRTFNEVKLCELAESIKHNGLIQPITVRPNNQGFEIVAGARRYRAAQLAELFSVPARIVEIDDAQALEWQLVENSQCGRSPLRGGAGLPTLARHPRLRRCRVGREVGQERKPRLRPFVFSPAHPHCGRGLHSGAHNGEPRQPHRTSTAGEPGRSLRAVLAQGLAGQRAAPATCQASCSVDTGQPLSVSRGCAVRPRRLNPEPVRRSLRYLPPAKRLQHIALLRCTG
jgi:hypothetical protein